MSHSSRSSSQTPSKYVPYKIPVRESKTVTTGSSYRNSAAAASLNALIQRQQASNVKSKLAAQAQAQAKAQELQIVRVHRERTKPIQQCEHLEKFKRQGGITVFAKMINTFVYPVTKKARDTKSRLCKCAICRTSIGVNVCLHCVHFACKKKGHMRNHYLLTGHCVVVSSINGGTYCFKCCDLFFDRDLEFLKEQFRRSLKWGVSLPQFTKMIPPFFYDHKVKLVFEKPVCSSENSTLGLRGLINLGHTCFMSCIVQALIHTPMLRDFFSAKKIKCDKKHDIKSQKPCIVSLVGDLYQEFYNGDSAPVSLHALLFKIWGNASHLAGYEQQDAHEFFIAMLDALHLHFHSPDVHGICRCVIDIIFLGRLESAVSCIACGHKSITHDPFWDTSLDLTSDQTGITLKLEDCLTRYTRLEHLGSSEMIFCAKCTKKQISTKQLKFESLPMVLCLHLKRFEHRTSYKKIDTRVDFPEFLYMNEYMTEFNRGPGPRTRAGSSSAQQQNLRDDFKYSLYAVVNHIGSLDGGHYYAYVRHAGNKNWFKCDDHFVIRASQEEVLLSPGYLLYYHKEVLNYDPKSAKLVQPKKRHAYIPSRKSR